MGNNRRALQILSDQKILLLILLIGIFLSVRSDYFLSFYNIVNIFSFIAIEGIIVIGMAFLIILKEIDLSVGAVMAFSGILSILFQKYGVLPGILAGLAGGAAVGLANGLIVTKFKVASIPVTLGMMVMVNGFVFALTKNQTVKGMNPDFTKFAQTNLANIPMYVLIFLALVVIFQIVLKRSIFGRNVFAVGGNAMASRFFGIKVDRVRIMCFLLSGLLAGLAGVTLASKLNVASGRIGVNTALLVITAVLLGGVSLAGGEGSIVKAFQGILLIGILNNAMVLLQISPFIQDMVRGGILITILIVDAVNTERAKYV